LKARVKELEQRCNVLTIENETLKAEVEIYREESAASSGSRAGADANTTSSFPSATNTTTTTTTGTSNIISYVEDDFVKGGDGVYAKSTLSSPSSSKSTTSQNSVLLKNLHGQSNILCCSLSSDDTILATGGADRSVALCEWGTVTTVDGSAASSSVAENVVSRATRIDCGAPVISIDFARKSLRTKFLVCGCMDGTVHIIYFERQGGSIEAREVATGSIKHDKYVRQVVWAPNDYVVATASADGSILIHKVHWNGIDDDGLSVEKVQSLQLPGPVESMCFSNDHTLCCYARGTPDMMCFDLFDGYSQQKINLNHGPGNAGFDDHVSFAVMDMSAYGTNYIALATDTSRNIVMDWRSGRQVRNLYGHQNDGYSQPKVAWSKNGHYMYGNTQDDSVVCVWDISSSSIVDRLDGHTNTVRDMFSSTSTDALVTCSFDKQTFLRFA
jgi:WD40 repeat protein